RLLELPHQICDLEHCFGDRSRPGGVHMEVSVAPLVAREQRCAACHIQDEVALRRSAVAGHEKLGLAARCRSDGGVSVDDDLEGAEMAGGRGDLPLVDGYIADARRYHVVGLFEEQGYAQSTAKSARHLERLLSRSVDKAYTVRSQGRRARGLHLGGG